MTVAEQQGETGPKAKADGASVLLTNARWLLAGFLVFAGLSHLIYPAPFEAQVPPWMPAPAAVILVSGLVEIALGVALVAVRSKRPIVGWVVAAFFVIVFPGNISQFLTHADAFGLGSDFARGVRLLFQPLLVVWALWCTGAWSAMLARRRR